MLVQIFSALAASSSHWSRFLLRWDNKLSSLLVSLELFSFCFASIAAFCKDDRWVDTAGRLHWKDGEVAVGFGKKQGELLKELVKSDKGYLDWILRGEFPEDTKDIIRKAFKGEFPVKK